MITLLDLKVVVRPNFGEITLDYYVRIAVLV